MIYFRSFWFSSWWFHFALVQQCIVEVVDILDVFIELQGTNFNVVVLEMIYQLFSCNKNNSFYSPVFNDQPPSYNRATGNTTMNRYLNRGRDFLSRSNNSNTQNEKARMANENKTSGYLKKSMYNRLLDECGDSDITNGSNTFVDPDY